MYFVNYRYKISIKWIELLNELFVSIIGYAALYIQLTEDLNIRYYTEIVIIATLLLNLLINAIRQLYLLYKDFKNKIINKKSKYHPQGHLKK